MNNYRGTKPIDIPNAEQCRVNHGLPPRKLGYKMRLKCLQKQQAMVYANNEVIVISREIEEPKTQFS